MKTKKIRFDLERWQKGDFVRVETCEDLEVVQLTYFEDAKGQNLAGHLLDEDDGVEKWCDNGAYDSDGEFGSILDLCLIVEDKEQEAQVADEYVWKYVLRSKSEGYVYVNYFEEERNDFFLLEIIKKEKVKLSDL